MEIKWLLDFMSLVDTRNFSRSADQRATTQPAFSRRIRALEDWMGAPLFDRSKQPIELTAAGQEFRPVAEEVLRRILQSRDEIRRIGQGTASTVSFTATHSLSVVFFPRWIRSVEQQTGVIQTRLQSHQIGNCVQALMRGECHFMLAPTHATTHIELAEDRFTSIKVGEDRLLPVSAPDDDDAPVHRLPGRPGAPVDFLAYAGSAASGHAVEHLLSHHKTVPVLREVFASHLAGVLKSMVIQGRGLAWLPESEAFLELESGTIVIAGDPSWFIPSEIRLFRSRDTLPDAAEALWTHLADARPASS